jgi:TP901 family phage tail tape measure protein
MAETKTLRLEILVDDRGTPVVKQFAGNVQNAADAMDKHGSGASKKLNEGLGKLTSGFGTALKSAAGFTAGLVGIQTGAAAISKAFDAMTGFEAAMSKVNTQLVDTPVTLAQMRAELLQLPPALGTSTELAGALFAALGAGVEPAKAVAFVGDAARLAKAGLTEADTAVKVLTTTMDIYGMGAEKAGHISDVLFTAIRLGKGEMSDLAGNIGNVLPLAQNLGVSFEEATATVTTLTKVFPSTSQAVTGLRSVFTGMVQNMDKFRAVGIDVKQVIAEKGLTGVFEALKTATGGSAEKVREFIPDIEGLTAVVQLLGPALQTQKDNVKAFGDVSGATSDAFAKSQDNLKASFNTLVGVIDRLVQKEAPPLLDALKELTDFLSANAVPAVNWLKDAWASLAPVFTVLGRWLDFVRGNFSLLASGVSDSIAIMLGALSKLTSAAAWAADKLGFEGVSAKMKAVSADLAQAATDTKQFADIAADTAKDWYKSAFGIQKDTAAIATETKKTGKDVKQILAEEGVKSIEALRAKYAEVPPAVNEVTSAIEGTRDKLVQVNGVWTNATGTVAAHNAALGQTTAALDATGNAATHAGEKARAAADSATDAWEELGLKAPHALKEVADKGIAAFNAIKASGEESQERLSAAALEAAARMKAAYGDNMAPAVKKVYDDLVAHIQGGAAAIGQAGADAGQQFADGFAGNLDRAVTAWDKLIEYTKQHPVDGGAPSAPGGGDTNTRASDGTATRAETPEPPETPAARTTSDRDYVRDTLGGDFAPIEHAFGDTRAELERQLADYTRQRDNVAGGYLAGGGSTIGTRGYREFQLPILDDALAQIRERLNALDDGLGVRTYAFGSNADRIADTWDPFAPRERVRSPSEGTTRTETSRASGVGDGDPSARYGDEYFRHANLPGHGGGGNVTTLQNPSFSVVLNGIDASAVDARALAQQLAPALRELIRRGELSGV